MNLLQKLTFFFFLPMATLSLKGQNLEKANAFYKNGYYAKAIPIYEAYLKKHQSIATKSKLANSYRLLNLAQQASIVYREIILDDKAQSLDYFRLGEVMMMMSQYDSARVYFTQYTTLQPEDERGTFMLASLDKMKNIVPALKNVIVEPFKHNTASDENVPVFYKNGIAFATDRKTGFKLLKQKNQTTGREYFNIFYTVKQGDTAFEQPHEMASQFFELNKNTGNISFTADSKMAFFCRNSNESSKDGAYNMQLYSAESNGKNGWKKIKPISFCTVEQNYMYPAISPDGNQLFFVMERGDGLGGLDIYVSKKTKKGWSKPENLGDKVNTSMHEGFPFMAPDGKLYFCSKGHVGFGGYDIFVTSQDSVTQEWKTPQNLGTPINSAYDDISIAFADSTWGAFTSSRNGQGDDIFFFKIKLNAPIDTLNQVAQKDTKSGFTFDIETENAFVADAKDLEENLVDTQIEKQEDTYLTQIYKKIEKGELKINSKYIVSNITFDTTDTTKITEETKAELDRIANFLKEYQKLNVEIGAHTEGVGDRKILKVHSQKLAEAMAAYLVSNGVKSRQVIAKGYGNIRPLKDCREGGCSEQEDLQNRRIELKIVKF